VGQEPVPCPWLSRGVPPGLCSCVLLPDVLRMLETQVAGEMAEVMEDVGRVESERTALCEPRPPALPKPTGVQAGGSWLSAREHACWRRPLLAGALLQIPAGSP